MDACIKTLWKISKFANWKNKWVAHLIYFNQLHQENAILLKGNLCRSREQLCFACRVLFLKTTMCAAWKKSLVMSIILISNSFSAFLKQCKNYRKQNLFLSRFCAAVFCNSWTLLIELCFQRYWFVKVKITAVVLLALFKIDIFAWYLEEGNSPEAPGSG